MEAHQLPFCGQTLQRFFLKYGGVILQIREDLRIQNHKTAVDEAGILLILLTEGTDRVVVADVQNPFICAMFTVVMVAVFPCSLWNFTRAFKSTVHTPSPYVIINGSSPIYG